MRKKIIAGNWKMNLNPEEAMCILERSKMFPAESLPNTEIMFAVPALYAMMAENSLRETPHSVLVQDVSFQDDGAFTGEISVNMVKASGLQGALVAHSERREYHNENNISAGKKIKKLLDVDLVAVYCIGEKLESRKNKEEKQIVKTQLTEALSGFEVRNFDRLVIAYEPVWAIGTGEVATVEQISEMHHFIREELSKLFGAENAEKIRILYGGSMKPENALEIIQIQDVDGGLIGGASLKFDDFKSIILSSI